MKSEVQRSYPTPTPIGVKVIGMFIVVTSLANLGTALSVYAHSTTNTSIYVLAALYCSVLLYTGIGILKLKPWARILALVMCPLLAIKVAVGSIIDIKTMINNSTCPVAILIGAAIVSATIALGAWVVFYLTRRRVKSRFGEQSEA